MVELHQRAGGTEGTNTVLQSAASLAVQSAGFQPLVRLQPANLLSRAGTYTVPKHTARQQFALFDLTEASHQCTQSQSTEEEDFLFFFSFLLWNAMFYLTHHYLQMQILK